MLMAIRIYVGTRMVRVQVKSTPARKRTGYLCHLRSAPQRPYTLANVDFFAGYVIPQDVWYLIPAQVVVGKIR